MVGEDTAGKPPFFSGCRGQHLRGVLTVKNGQAAFKEISVSKGARKPNPDGSAVAGNDGTDFKELEPDGRHLCPRQFGPTKG